MTKRDDQAGRKQGGKVWMLVLVLLALVTGVFYFVYTQQVAEDAASLETPPILPEIAEPQPRREQVPDEPAEQPADPLEVVAEPTEEAPDPLPELAHSDEEAMSVAAQVLGEDQARNYLVPEGLISKMVATIDALTGDELPGNIVPVRGPGGEMQATSDGVSDEINPETGLPEPQYVMDPVNFQRYTAQVEAFEAIDVDELLENYQVYHPLLQQSFRELGYADGNFEDRLFEVIDELLATPEPGQPVRLIKPEAFYEFADPDLEALSAGQKILVRMGPANASRVKKKLEEIRSAIQTQRE